MMSTSPTASRLAGYFGQSPTVGSALEGEGQETEEFRQRAGGRRMSTGWAGRPFGPTSPTAAASPPSGEGAGLMRRFSLSGAFGRPFVPPPPTAPVTGPLGAANEAKMPTISEPPSHAPVLSPAPQTLGNGRGRMLTAPRQPKKRSVSPMSERILKGQFDGFV